jgi:hypothetical protein
MKWYALGVASRVRSASTDAAVAVLAAVPTRGHAEILLGYLDTHDRPLAATAPSPRSWLSTQVRGQRGEVVGVRRSVITPLVSRETRPMRFSRTPMSGCAGCRRAGPDVRSHG